MVAYKLLRKRKNGTLGPLFINRRSRLPLDQWLEAEDHPTKGYAHRPGWHILHNPNAPHLSKRDRVWVKVQFKDYKKITRPEAQGGVWYLAKQMKVLQILNDVPIYS